MIGIGIAVIVLGAILLVAGILVVVIVPRELSKWEGMLGPLPDMLGGLEIPGLTALMPMLVGLLKASGSIIAGYLRLAVVLGGGITIIGVILIVIGYFVGFVV